MTHESRKVRQVGQRTSGRLFAALLALLCLSWMASAAAQNFHLVAPENGAAQDSNTVEFTWKSNGVAAYYVIFVNDEDADWPDAQYKFTEWDMGATPAGGNIESSQVIDEEGVWYWKVKGRTASGSLRGTSIETWQVTIDSEAPVITLLGDNPQMIERRSSYEELGATATDNYDNGGDPIDLEEDDIDSSEVNTDEVGEYEVRYNFTDSAGNAAEEVRRTVIVFAEDTEPPQLAYQGTPVPPFPPLRIQVTLPPLLPLSPQVLEALLRAGVTATDNVDEELTINIDDISEIDTSVVHDYEVWYTVTDSSENTTTEPRTVSVVDEVLPVIRLEGDNPLTIEQTPERLSELELDALLREGVTATDNYDDDLNLTESITIDGISETNGDVDTSAVGEYVVTYNVSDSSGNEARSYIRTIRVVEPVPGVDIEGPHALEVGDDLELTAVLDEDIEGPVEYQWLLDGEEISSDIIDPPTPPHEYWAYGVEESDEGFYEVRVTYEDGGGEDVAYAEEESNGHYVMVSELGESNSIVVPFFSDGGPSPGDDAPQEGLASLIQVRNVEEEAIWVLITYNDSNGVDCTPEQCTFELFAGAAVGWRPVVEDEDFEGPVGAGVPKARENGTMAINDGNGNGVIDSGGNGGVVITSEGQIVGAAVAWNMGTGSAWSYPAIEPPSE